MLLLVRHGRTDANATGLLLGRADIPLDDIGRRQAAALVEVVGRPSRVISSPLRRCRQTAEAFGVPVEVDDRWIELDYGRFDQTPMGDVPRDVWQRWRSDLDFAPPGGESIGALGVRVRSALDELAPSLSDAAAGDTVVVSHVSPIKAAVAWALGVGDEVTWRMFVGVASVTRVAVTERGPLLHAFNQTLGDHLYSG